MGKYSGTLMDHFFAPRNAGRMDSPDRSGRAGSAASGLLMVLQLRLLEDRVAEARFQTFGCGVAIACGSALTEMVTGRTLQECRSITEVELAQALGGVPDDKLHCPALAITALRDALGH
jgi:NifU-like protein involved in Fe-S cluster formation